MKTTLQKADGAYVPPFCKVREVVLERSALVGSNNINGNNPESFDPDNDDSGNWN